jgi:ABC-type transport system involved in multi-copper enzyme maturation permease subunit
MSVYKRDYRAYAGRTTPLWTRVLVLARYGLNEVWASKITVGISIFSALPIVVAMVQIYLVNNPVAKALILRGGSRLFEIDARFFLRMLSMQCWLGLALAAWIAPRLISYDLSDNALPILLSHPISRPGYVLGKFLALFASLSTITWFPCMLLFVYQAYSAPEGWLKGNAAMGLGILAGCVLWIVLLSILSLALSSWVKWKVVATLTIFAAVLVPAGVGGIVSAVLRTKWGLLLNVPVMMTQLWQRMVGAPEIMRHDLALPTAAIVSMLGAACLLSLAMLNARIRGREVVRG